MDGECQHLELTRAYERLSLLDRVINLSLRMMSALHRRFAAKDRRVHFITGKRPGVGNTGDTTDMDLKKEAFVPGDIVEIRPWSVIREILDDNFSTQGLVFMPGMERFCGRRARVFKKIRMVYDEQRQKMVKIRDTYILEGIICEGRDAFDKEGCDKSCFYFWKRQWLHRVMDSATGE